MLASQGAGLALAAIWVLASGDGPPPAHDVLPGVAAGAGGAIALSAFYRALSIGTMSIVAPISATGALVPVVVGVAGGDRPGAVQAVGMAVAVVGVVLASREDQQVDDAAAAHSGEPGRRAGGHAAKAADARRSVALALVAALGFGLFLTLMKPASDHSVPWALLFARLASVSAIGLAAAATGAAVRPVFRRAALPGVALVGALDVGANALYGVATTKGLLSIVAVLGDLYPVSTILLARLVLRERVRRSQEAGIIAVLAGVAMIAAG
jgi:drug/metabolite transporter (DMT)-like permease